MTLHKIYWVCTEYWNPYCFNASPQEKKKEGINSTERHILFYTAYTSAAINRKMPDLW
jgi:hypothetical protein